MTAISDLQARYLKRALQLNPVWRAADVIELRSRALGLARLDRPQSEVDSVDVARLRQAAKEQIAHVQTNFWKIPLESLKRTLEFIDVQRLPELAPVVNRLRTAAACRGEFPRLSQAAWMDSALFEAFKTAVVLPPADAGAVRERFLNRIEDKRQLKRIKTAVSRIESEYPILFALERDWFHTLKNYKLHRAPVMDGASGASFEMPEIGWPAWIGIFILIRVILRFLIWSSSQ